TRRAVHSAARPSSRAAAPAKSANSTLCSGQKCDGGGYTVWKYWTAPLVGTAVLHVAPAALLQFSTVKDRAWPCWSVGTWLRIQALSRLGPLPFTAHVACSGDTRRWRSHVSTNRRTAKYSAKAETRAGTVRRQIAPMAAARPRAKSA